MKFKFELGDLIKIPNILCYLRILMVPLFLHIYFTAERPQDFYLATLVVMLSGLTDFFDGQIARRCNMITDLGRIIDPLADKLLVCSALICLVNNDKLQAWIVIVIIAREFIISGFRLVASDNGVVIAASYWGKFKTVSQMAMIILCILDINNTVMQYITVIVTYLALVLTVVSLVDYMVKNKKVLSEGSR